MKVIQINCVYPEGSTGRITADIHRYLLKHSVQSEVLYGRGKRVNEKGAVKVCSELYAKMNNLFSRLTGVMYGGAFFSTNRIIRTIKKEKPDIVHLQCINGYFVNIFRLLDFLKKNKVKTVLTLHAEFMYTGSCSHAFECEKWISGCGNCPRNKAEIKSLFFDNTAYSNRRLKKVYEGFDELRVVSVSPWLFKRAVKSPILKNKNHKVILNGVDTAVFKPRNTENLKKKYAAKNEKIIFHATAFFSSEKCHPKGGYYVIELAGRMPQVKFLVAGKAKKISYLPENVVYLGEITDPKKLAEFYSLSDLTLLTSKRETFSMVAAESFCCGTPVVGFEAGAPEMISLSAFSEFVPYGNLKRLESAVENLLNLKAEKEAEICSEAADLYDKNIMAENYMKLYRSML